MRRPGPASAPLVVTEGNYLLARPRPVARGRAGCSTRCWYLEPPEDVRIDRLVARHVAYGKEPAAARAWSLGTDQRNAELVADTRRRADLILRVDAVAPVAAPPPL